MGCDKEKKISIFDISAKTHNLGLIMRKQIKTKLREVLQNDWPTIFDHVKATIDLPCDPAIPVLCKYSSEVIQTNIWTLMFIAAFFTIAKKWKQYKCS